MPNTMNRLQAAMKLPLGNAEGPAAHLNLISNQAMETNITINWTGGGQVNECKLSIHRYPNLRAS